MFEVHPELGFYQLNGDVPLRRPKHTVAGPEERLNHRPKQIDVPGSTPA